MNKKIRIIYPLILIILVSFFLGCSKKLHVSFETNGGSEIEDLVIFRGKEFDLPANPTREGYSFDGWFLDDGLSVDYNFSLIEKATEDFSLYAKWAINTYTISFNSMGGEKVESIDYEYHDIISLPQAVKEGCSFAGWYEDEALTIRFTENAMPAKNFVLYAAWNLVEYTIEFNTNGGSNVESIKGVYNESIKEPNNPAKLGYTFAGWFIDSSLTIPYEFNLMPAEDITLYAKWDVNSYNVEFRVDDINYKSFNKQ